MQALSMTSQDSIPSAEPVAPPATSASVSQDWQIRIRVEGTHLQIWLPAESEKGTTGLGLTWNELWQQLRQRLNAGERFWQPQTEVHLMVQDRLLDGRQLQAIADALAPLQLCLQRVHTSRRQTAVVAATAGYSVEQQSAGINPLNSQTQTAPTSLLAEPLYLQMTLRSGAEIRHPGTVVILGDVNPGSSVIAEGDIIVWGRLRGVAHAGAKGSYRCIIAALHMEPTQLRIADFVARAPATTLTEYYPEVAYATTKGIRIARSADFSKNSFLSQQT
jgi:septum site-determining protein MinC